MTSPAKGFPIIIAYSRPFRLIYKNKSENWSPSLEEINHRRYDHVRLHRLSATFDIALAIHPFLYMGFDGALILPALPEFTPVEKVVPKFNRFLGELLLGGIYYEAIDPSDIVRGVLYETGYFRSVEAPHGPNADRQIGLQIKMASPIHTINLYKPDFITAAELHEAKQRGSLITETIPTLSPELFLRGVSAFVGRTWAEALSNLWICIEQITSFLWEKKIVCGEPLSEIPIQGRKKFLLDTRTWTSSTRIELLFQKQIVNATTYALINKARKARNALAHQGTLPDRSDGEAAFDAFFQLVSGICCSFTNELDGMATKYKDMDPITRKSTQALKEPIPLDKFADQSDDMLWLGPFPPIPGESEWKDRENPAVAPEQDDRNDMPKA